MLDLPTLLHAGMHQWDGQPPASAWAVESLVAWSPAKLPGVYLSLLSLSNGGHASLSVYPCYLRIWSAESAVESNRDYEVQRHAPGFVGFGDDGGEVVVGFDVRSGPPYRVAAIPIVPMEWAAAVEVATDFESLIGRLVPR